MKKFSLLLAVLLFAHPARAQLVDIFLDVSAMTQDTGPSSLLCNTPVFQTGQKSGYYYIPCVKDSTWSGGNFQWKFHGIVPGWIHTPYVNFSVLYESRLNVVGGNQALQFDIGGIVMDSACNTATAKTNCKIITTLDPPLTYTTTATNSVSNGRCQGATDASGTADEATCTADSGCTSTDQICLSRVQATDFAVSSYRLQQVGATDDLLHDAITGSISDHAVTYTVQLNDSGTTIDRDYRVLGLLVYYDQ